MYQQFEGTNIYWFTLVYTRQALKNPVNTGFAGFGVVIYIGLDTDLAEEVGVVCMAYLVDFVALVSYR